ncbi:hypothetical protein Srubr_32930 [Streptomyces rubradiris]|uniref:Uncharacterized protein n=1 Tax=Streptomyces rubradiris TaxID=285531 RepID=A0ABQ3RCB8_STRRR|nr:hypothetical protein GCM10018792_01860 [Streptomyces rubradiris]GHI53447.1 hypothetical protein Srubr_32930 [Streptomyces rubradiris]
MVYAPKCAPWERGEDPLFATCGDPPQETDPQPVITGRRSGALARAPLTAPTTQGPSHAEPLVGIRRAPLPVVSRKQDGSDAFSYSGEGVLERLLQAQAHLPDGLRFQPAPATPAPGCRSDRQSAQLHLPPGTRPRRTASDGVDPPSDHSGRTGVTSDIDAHGLTGCEALEDN